MSTVMIGGDGVGRKNECSRVDVESVILSESRDRVQLKLMLDCVGRG